MGDDVVVAITLVDAGLEYLDTLARDFSASKSADQFLALAAEHRPAYDFNPSETAFSEVHVSNPVTSTQFLIIRRLRRARVSIGGTASDHQNCGTLRWRSRESSR